VDQEVKVKISVDPQTGRLRGDQRSACICCHARYPQYENIANNGKKIAAGKLGIAKNIGILWQSKN
jgi:hypothetical protein